jgi:DNA integrity scanning protein DisA with diadenylate cyclase activity
MNSDRLMNAADQSGLIDGARLIDGSRVIAARA